MNQPQKGIVNIGQILTSIFPVQPIKTLVIHRYFHTDEAVCVWMVRRFEQAHELFPGIAQAVIEEWGSGQALRPTFQPETLFFGCTMTSLDEHGLPKEEYKMHCAATLVAQRLELEGDRALAAVLRKVKIEDRQGAQHPTTVHAVLKLLHRMKHGLSPDELLEWAILPHEAEYREYVANPPQELKTPPLKMERARELIEKHFDKDKADRWYDVAQRAIDADKERRGRLFAKLSDDRRKGDRSEYWRTINYRGRSLPMVVIQIDSKDIVPVAFGLGAAVLVKQDPQGRTIIFTNRDLEIAGEKVKIDLTDAIGAIRLEELEIMVQSHLIEAMPALTPDELRARGHVEKWPLCQPYWFLHDTPGAANQAYCGSETAENVSVTRLTIDRIARLIQVAIGGRFHDDYFRDCVEGNCAGAECPLFKWHFRRCARVREPKPATEERRGGDRRHDRCQEHRHHGGREDRRQGPNPQGNRRN